MLFSIHRAKYTAFLFALVLLTGERVNAQHRDSSKVKPKTIWSVLRTVREVHFTNDTLPEIFQVETTKAKKARDVKIHFAIYKKDKKLYEHSWKANDFFDPKDHLSDTIKWLRLQHILRVFFSDQNFTLSTNENLAALFSRVQSADIHPGSDEAKEYESSPHNIFAVYAGRETLYGITWLESKKKFVTLWHN